MRHFISILLISIIAFVCARVEAQEIKVLSFEEFQTHMQQETGQLRVYNFWATWCRPCVAELPYFEKIQSQYNEQGIEVVLVSLDFSDQVEKRVKPFAKRKKLKSELLLLDEMDYNAWIDKVSPEWSGAIPATLLVMPEKDIYSFAQREFSYDQLKNYIFTTLSDHGLETPQ